MVWVSSPPNFSACTETVADMANDNLGDCVSMKYACNTPHRLDVVSETQPVVETQIAKVRFKIDTVVNEQSTVMLVPISSELVSSSTKLVGQAKGFAKIVCLFASPYKLYKYRIQKIPILNIRQCLFLLILTHPTLFTFHSSIGTYM